MVDKKIFSILNEQTYEVIPCTFKEWMDKYADKPLPIPLKWTEAAPYIYISTIFTGMPNAFDGVVPFETMVLGGIYNMEQYRYRSYDEALAQHDIIVEKVKQAYEQGNKKSDVI